MKVAFLSLMAVSYLSSVPVLADWVGNPYQSACATGYHSDSFGLGIETAVRGVSRAPVLLDEGCYQLGADFARQAMKQADSASSCLSDFNDGRKEGLLASGIGAGNGCYVLGYKAGMANLDEGAREGDADFVGQSCVDNYAKGVSDYRSGLAATQPDFDNKQSQCYSMGYFDGPVAPAAPAR